MSFWNFHFQVRKLFTCGAFIAQTIFMLATAYTHSITAAVICITIAVGSGGFAWSGFRYIGGRARTRLGLKQLETA